MNLLDPFTLFCAVEIVALSALLVVWLDAGFHDCHVTLHCYLTPELIYLQFPMPVEVPPALDEAVDYAAQEVSSGPSPDSSFFRND
jgi:hypothetical protein